MHKLIFGSVLTLATLVLVGCHSSSPTVTYLPPPVVPAPPARDKQASPTPPPPPLTAVRPPSIGSVRGLKIVIDAGHGGKDPGTRGVSALPEKTIVLSVANQVARLLEERGANVIKTRSGDRFVELDDRARIAERNRVDLFVSIHADSAGRAEASGATIYIGRNASNDSQRAARSIGSALTRAGISLRGIRRAGYRVLVGHSRPAVLVECGFLTNRSDAKRLNSHSHRMHIANAIAEGIANFAAK